MNHAKVTAERYAAALRRFLREVGYGDVPVTIGKDGDAHTVTCEIASLSMNGQEVDMDGFHFDLADYGYVPVPGVDAEPYAAWKMHFYG